MNKKLIFSALAVLCMGPSLAHAAPQKMNYQGRLAPECRRLPGGA